MPLKDWVAKLTGRPSAANADGTKRPDGGTSCYRPIRRRSVDETQLAREKAAEYAAEDWQIPYAHTGFTDMNPPLDYGYAPDGWPTGPAGMQQAAPQQNTAGRGYVPPQQPRQGNISYMPGAYTPETETAGAAPHTEHILVMTSLKSCYEAIECMKNGETLIVTLDAIANEGETARCQDMLAGAAFTLGCSVRMLQGARLVLIAPPGVRILPEQQRQRPETPAYGVQEQQYAPVREKGTGFRRERRSSENAAGWNGTGTDAYGYNPYTGTMPAAAGSFGSYGGYGY